MKLITAILLGSSLFILGCAAPGQVKEKAASTLQGKCYDIFVDSSHMGYQHCAHQISTKCAFALSKDKNDPGKQVCSTALWWELIDNLCVINCKPTQTQVESLALSRCEALRDKNGSFNEPCKIFARNNEIIWEDSKKEDVKFQ